MRKIAFLLSSLLVMQAAAQETTAKTFLQTSDKTAGVSVFGFRGTDNKTYVLSGDPASFALPVTGTFSLSPSPILFRRNGADQQVTLDTSTSSNNRPLPFTLLAGDSLGPVATGIGISNSSTLRVHVGNSSSLDVNVTNSTLDVRMGDSAGNGLTSTNVSGKQSLDVNVSQSALPTGAATETTLAAINTKTPALSSGRVPVDVQASVLPTGAATETTLAGIKTRVDVVDFGVTTAAQRTAAVVGNLSGAISNANPLQTDITVGNYATSVTAARQSFGNSGGLPTIITKSLLMGWDSATSTHREISTDADGNVLTKEKGRFVVTTYRQSLASNSVSTTYDQVVLSTSGETQMVDVFWPGDEPLWLATGGSGAEVVQLYVPPGGGTFPLNISSGTRVAVRSEASTYSSGYLVITLYN